MTEEPEAPKEPEKNDRGFVMRENLADPTEAESPIDTDGPVDVVRQNAQLHREAVPRLHCRRG